MIFAISLQPWLGSSFTCSNQSRGNFNKATLFLILPTACSLSFECGHFLHKFAVLYRSPRLRSARVLGTSKNYIPILTVNICIFFSVLVLNLLITTLFTSGLLLFVINDNEIGILSENVIKNEYLFDSFVSVRYTSAQTTENRESLSGHQCEECYETDKNLRSKYY